MTDWLLRTCASVRILATSREALATAGERVIAVAPLQVPAGDTVSDVDTSAAGALFIARAKDANAEWQVNARNAPAVAHICRSLDGIPLAVELAAARSAMLNVSDIASRLGARLELLQRPTRSGEARHHTLRAALEWSYDLLNDSEQRLFRRLSVFVDSFDVDAVIAIGATPDVDVWGALDSLASLVGKSLVEQDPRAAGRYRLLETIRHYASTLLADEEERRRPPPRSTPATTCASPAPRWSSCGRPTGSKQPRSSRQTPPTSKPRSCGTPVPLVPAMPSRFLPAYRRRASSYCRLRSPTDWREVWKDFCPVSARISSRDSRPGVP